MNTVAIKFKRIVSPILLEVVSDVSNLKTCREDSDATFIWFDGIFSFDKYVKYTPFKRLNKIPGMNRICYKSKLFDVLGKMKNKMKLKDEYSDCVPDTYIVDKDNYDDILNNLDQKKLWILKPESSYGGKGIIVFKKKADIISYPKSGFVIQRYISPYLIDGFKFDFRIYLLIKNLNPLSLFIYKDGIARFCSEKYDINNLENKYSHLTNVSINCQNVQATSEREHIKLYSEVVDTIFTNKEKTILFEKIKNLSGKTILALYGNIRSYVLKACENNERSLIEEKKDEETKDEEAIDEIKEPEPENNEEKIDPLNRFFHLLGIDILIDQNLNPYILELNDNPALKCFNDLEVVLKKNLIKSEISLISDVPLIKDDKVDDDCFDNWEEINLNSGSLGKIKAQLKGP